MASFSDLTPGIWKVDPAHSEVAFVARHLVVAKVRGVFTEYDATVTIGDSPENSSVSATVQLASLDTRNADRDTHLRSGDFFDVENHPTMTFQSTKITPDTLVGDLTIRGVSRPVTFDVTFNGVTTDPWGNTKAGFEAEAEVNRKDWDLVWNVPLEGGGMLVGDKVKLTIDAELIKSA
ncbi:MAG TPA: YceI family protein [Dermatophilaceae bacterium]|nr:YceI family protein [Dermatophilaceae bacterium]